MGFAPTVRRVVFAQVPEATITVTLAKGGRLRVGLSDPAGAPIPGPLVEQAREDVFAYTIRVHCLPRPGEETGVEVVDHVKLFRNHPDLRFEFRMHEQILPSVRRLGKQVAYTDAFVTHAGYDTSPEGQQRKRARAVSYTHLTPPTIYSV